jgi:hypothetical protein
MKNRMFPQTLLIGPVVELDGRFHGSKPPRGQRT